MNIFKCSEKLRIQCQQFKLSNFHNYLHFNKCLIYMNFHVRICERIVDNSDKFFKFNTLQVNTMLMI